MTSDEFTAIYQKHYQKIEMYFRKRVWWCNAEDYTSETFVKAWTNRSKYSDDGKVLNWLYRLAHNVWVDQVRHHQNHSPITQQFPVGFEPVCEWATTDFLEYEAKEYNRQILSVATPVSREIIWLEQAGYKDMEIAEKLGIDYAIVRSRRHRALKVVRKRLLARSVA